MPLRDDLVAQLRDLARVDRMRALALLRRETACTLPEAIARLDALAPVEAKSEARVVATLYAVGAYSASVAECMEYGADVTGALHTGASICVHVCEAFGAEQVVALADVLAVDPHDVSQHHLDPLRIDAAALERLDLVDARDVERLRAAGFAFYFWLEPTGATPTVTTSLS